MHEEIKNKIKALDLQTKISNTKNKSIDFYQSDTFDNLKTGFFSVLYMLFIAYPLFRLKNKLLKKHTEEGTVDSLKGANDKDKKKHLEDFKANKKSRLAYNSIVPVLLGIGLFLVYASFTGDSISPVFMIGLLVVMFLIAFLQNLLASTGRRDIDLIIKYYVSQKLSIYQIKKVIAQYYAMIEDLQNTYLSSKTNIISVDFDVPLTKDNNLGLILSITVDNAKNMPVNDLISLDYLYPKAIGNDFYTIIDECMSVMLDMYIYQNALGESFDFVDYFKDNPLYIEHFSDFDYIKKQQKEDNVKNKLESKGLKINARKLITILDKIEANKDTLGFNAWDSFGTSVEGNQNYIKLNCKFLKGYNISHLKKETVESIINSDVIFEESVNSKQTFSLTIIFKKFIDDFELKYDDLVGYARDNNQLLIGRTITGEFVADMTANAFFPFISGESGSGKSVTTMGEMVQILEMRDFNFEDLFIISGGKTGDYFESGFDKRGALILDILEEMNQSVMINEEQKVWQIVRAFELIVKKMLQREALFKENSVRNIYVYNDLIAKNEIEGVPLGEILVVVDEAQSLLNIADSYKMDKVSCKDKILSQVQKILNLGRASGVKLLYVTQSAKVSALGDGIKDGLTVEILGRNKSNVLMGVDKSGALSKYFANLSASGRRTEGVVFVRSSVLQSTTEQLNFKDGFVLCKTPYVDNKTIAEGFKHDFSTYNNYNNLIKNFEISVSDYLNEPSIIEDTQESNSFNTSSNDSSPKLDFDSIDL